MQGQATFSFTLAFVGYGTEEQTAVIELTYNWDTHAYEIGRATAATRGATVSDETP